MILAVVAGILLVVGLGEARIARSNSAQIEALTIAEAGAEKVLARLGSDPYWEYWPKEWTKSFVNVPLGDGYIAEASMVSLGNSIMVKAVGKKDSFDGRTARRGVQVKIRWQLPSLSGAQAINLLGEYPDLKPKFNDFYQRAAYTFSGPTEISSASLNGKSGVIFVNGNCRLSSLGTYSGHMAIVVAGKLEVEGYCQPADSNSGLVLVAQGDVRLLPSAVQAVIISEGSVIAEAGSELTGMAFANDFVCDPESSATFSAALTAEVERLLPGASFHIESWQEEYPVF